MGRVDQANRAVTKRRSAYVPVTRLAFSRRLVARSDSGFRLRARAFLPYRGSMSVFRIDGLDESGVWSHVDKHAHRPGRNIHGRADFKLADMEADVLELHLDETPPRHGNITGWPDATDQQLVIARELAAVASAVLAP